MVDRGGRRGRGGGDGGEPGGAPDAARRRVGRGSDRHFSDERRAVLFSPGSYRGLDVEVGYYVQLAGLGSSADDVVFSGCERGPHVEALNKDLTVGGRRGLSLDTFWRAAENFRTEASGGMMWAVSQACPLRRVRVIGDLILHDAGAYASGGHLANASVGGRVDFGSQQQFLCRSVDFREMRGGASREDDGGGGRGEEGEGYPGRSVAAWSTVFVDCRNPPPERCGGVSGGRAGKQIAGPSVAVHNPSVTVEKPFVAMRGDGKTYDLRVPRPRVRRRNIRGEGEGGPLGSDLKGADDDVRSFSKVRVAVATVIDNGTGEEVPDLDVAASVNEALWEGKDVILSPGIYHLKEPLRIVRDDQVLLGLGLATLVAPTNGRPCVCVASNLRGVRIAGIMLEASEIADRIVPIASLLEWGEAGISGGADPGDGGNPGVLTDVFARVGGSSLNRNVSTDVMVRIHSGNVLGDNIWLWRADHVRLRPGEVPNFPPLDYHQVTGGECVARTGLEVNGNDVTIHGLAVEHTTEDQVVWNGEGGDVRFYQNELPYDASPNLFGEGGFVGYRVNDRVQSHRVEGIGVYSNFRDCEVKVETAIRHPRPDQVSHAFTVKLDNNGTIQSVLNGCGGPAIVQGVPVHYR